MGHAKAKRDREFKLTNLAKGVYHLNKETGDTMIEILKLFSHTTLSAIADYTGMVIEVPLVPDTPEYDTFLADVSESVNIKVLANFILDCPDIDIMETTEENKHILLSLLHRDILEAYIVARYEADDDLDKMTDEEIRKSLEQCLFEDEVTPVDQAALTSESSVVEPAVEQEPLSAAETANQMVFNYILVGAFVALGYRGVNLTKSVVAQFNDPIHLNSFINAAKSVSSGVVDKNISDWYSNIIEPNAEPAYITLSKLYQDAYGVSATDVELRSFASACGIKVRESGLSSLSVQNHAQNVEHLISTIKGNTVMNTQQNQNTNAAADQQSAVEEVTVVDVEVPEVADVSLDLDDAEDLDLEVDTDEPAADSEEQEETVDLDEEEQEDDEEEQDESDFSEDEPEELEEDEDYVMEDILRSVPVFGQSSVFSIRTNLVVNAVADSAEVSASELRSLVANGTTVDAYTPLRYSSDNEKFGALNEALSSIALFLSEYNDNHKAIVVAGNIDYGITLEDQSSRVQSAVELLLEEETSEVVEQLVELDVDADDLWNVNTWVSMAEGATGPEFVITVSLNIRAPMWFASSKNLNVARSTVARLLGGDEYSNLESSLVFSCSTNALLTSDSVYSIFQAHASSTITQSIVTNYIEEMAMIDALDDDYEDYEDADEDSDDDSDSEDFEDMDSLDTINGIDVDRMANLCLPFDESDSNLLFPMDTNIAFVFAISEAEEDAE